jgi:hypothetical protein
MPVLTKVTCSFNAIFVKIPMTLFTEIEKEKAKINSRFKHKIGN